MDAVYIVRPGDDNEELRYSLRSLKNLPIDNVHIVGYKPTFIGGCNYIPVVQDGEKHENARKNMFAALNSQDIPESFLLMNDDFYVMKPQSSLPNYHRGTERQVIKSLPRGHSILPHWMGFKATMTVLSELGYREPLCYSLHVPIVLQKDAYKEALRLTAPPFFTSPLAPHVRTVYGNLAGLGGELMESDVKWRGAEPVTAAFAGQAYASSMDRGFKNTPRERYVRGLFKEACGYEHG
jgi:hypothetical protein